MTVPKQNQPASPPKLLSRSILAEELERLHEIRREEEASDAGVASIELERQQIDALCLIARLVREEHLHLVLIVRCTLELPLGDDEGLEAAQVSQDQ